MPLSIIRGNTDVIKRFHELDKLSDIDLTQYLNSISNNTEKLIKLITNLLDLSRDNAGFSTTQWTAFDFKKLITDICFNIKQECPNISLKFNASSRGDYLIVGDCLQIERIVLNLVTNSIKYAGMDKDITISLKEDKENKNLLINFSDNGPGIPYEYKDDIFKPFFQVADFTTRTTEGSGLGLTIVKQFITNHGGSIKLAKHKTKKGTEFLVTLPKNHDKLNTIAQNNDLSIMDIKMDIIREFSDINA
jgi:signal transduction histidine kinase